MDENRLYKCLHIPTSTYLFNGMPLTKERWTELFFVAINLRYKDMITSYNFIEEEE